MSFACLLCVLRDRFSVSECRTVIDMRVVRIASALRTHTVDGALYREGQFSEQIDTSTGTDKQNEIELYSIHY